MAGELSMSERDAYCHGLRFDKTIRIATDNISGTITNPEYQPNPPPVEGYFLLSDGSNFLLSDGTNLVLS